MIKKYSQPRHIKWHFIPVQSPHQGGLWEAGVREMKRILIRIIGDQKLYCEDIATILTDIEATLNSRPMAQFEAHQEDGSSAFTPGHFLIGRPLLAAPTPVQDLDGNITGLRRWNLIKRLTASIWSKWKDEYLKLHHVRSKWKRRVPTSRRHSWSSGIDSKSSPYTYCCSGTNLPWIRWISWSC